MTSLAKLASRTKEQKYGRRGLFLGSAAAIAAEANRRANGDKSGKFWILALPLAGYGYGTALGRRKDKRQLSAYERLMKEEGYE